jgi:hypothetical protein
MLSLLAIRTVCVIPGCTNVEELCRLIMLLSEMPFTDLMIDVLRVRGDKASAIKLSLPFKYLISNLNCPRVFNYLIALEKLFSFYNIWLNLINWYVQLFSPLVL